MFVVLGTEDAVIERSYLLEYCREKYRGSLKVTTDQLLCSPQHSASAKSSTQPRVLYYLERLRKERDALSKIEEENLLQVRGAGHNLHFTQTALIGEKLVELIRVCEAIEMLRDSRAAQPKL